MEENYFIVSLNASKFTPKELRQSQVNIIIKFNLESPVPVNIYKIANPKGWILIQG